MKGSANNTGYQSGQGGTLAGGINHDSLDFKLYQDERPFIEQAKLDREMQTKKDVGYKKACTIPDIVAIELNYKYGIDIHADEFMKDPAQVKKVLKIIKSEYPYLMSY